jgi:hypothetical protein
MAVIPLESFKLAIGCSYRGGSVLPDVPVFGVRRIVNYNTEPFAAELMHCISECKYGPLCVKRYHCAVL